MSSFDVDGLDVQVQSSFAVVDGVTLSAGKPGVTVAGSIMNLEPGAANLGVGSERSAMLSRSADAAASPQVFEGGARGHV